MTQARVSSILKIDPVSGHNYRRIRNRQGWGCEMVPKAGGLG